MALFEGDLLGLELGSGMGSGAKQALEWDSSGRQPVLRLEPGLDMAGSGAGAGARFFKGDPLGLEPAGSNVGLRAKQVLEWDSLRKAICLGLSWAWTQDQESALEWDSLKVACSGVS